MSRAGAQVCCPEAEGAACVLECEFVLLTPVKQACGYIPTPAHVGQTTLGLCTYVQLLYQANVSSCTASEIQLHGELVLPLAPCALLAPGVRDHSVFLQEATGSVHDGSCPLPLQISN